MHPLQAFVAATVQSLRDCTEGINEFLRRLGVSAGTGVVNREQEQSVKDDTWMQTWTKGGAWLCFLDNVGFKGMKGGWKEFVNVVWTYIPKSVLLKAVDPRDGLNVYQKSRVTKKLEDPVVSAHQEQLSTEESIDAPQEYFERLKLSCIKYCQEK